MNQIPLTLMTDPVSTPVRSAKRILIVTDAWAPQVNGVVRTLDTVAREAARLGHLVGFITPSQFRTVPTPTYPEIPLAVMPRRRIRRMIEAFQPDHLHIATEGPLGWAARRYALRRGLPFTTAYHTRFPEYVKARFRIPLRLSYGVMRRFHKPSRGIMVATHSMREELGGRGFANIQEWSRGVDIARFTPGPKDVLGDIARPVFTYVGRVAVEKNIDAFLSLDLPGTKLVVGDGPELPRLKTRHPEALFVGARHGEDLTRHFQAADVFVFPSLTDTFGLVMLEALACGVPVAAFPVPGPIDVLSSKVGAMNTDLRVAALAALKLDPQDCRDYAVSFSWEATTHQFLANLSPFNSDWPPTKIKHKVLVPYRP